MAGNRVDLSFEGQADDGDILVVDGALPNFRTEHFPAYVQTLPRVPKLAKGQRAILVYEGTQLGWRIKNQGVTGGQSAGISLLMVLAVVVAYDKWKNRKVSKHASSRF